MTFTQFLTFCTVVLSTAAYSAPSLNERINKDELAFMNDSDPAMPKAFERAQSTLDEFLSTFKSQPPGYRGFAVKVAIQDGGATEYFWLNGLILSSPKFSGKINNHPRTVRSVRFGQVYSFSRSQIVDWLYVDERNRRMHGNFTACALLTKESPSEAEAMQKRFGLSCEKL